METGQSGLDELEHYLASATVLDVAAFSHNTAHKSYRLLLEGGVAVMAKPADTAPEGVVMCQREAAAWILARAIGWSEIVAATVMRTITSPSSGDEVETSVQVIWPDALPDAPPDLFGEEDVWRAAVFDVLVGHADRGGHNWLAVPGSSPEPRLKLIDHGYGFPTEVTAAPNSTFYAMRRGEDVPTYVHEALDELAAWDETEHTRLAELLGDESLGAVIDRAAALQSMHTLDIETT